MSRYAMRHRSTPPLHETARPLYVLLCRAQGRHFNHFEFINWLVERTRPYSVRGVDVETMKADVLKKVAEEIALLVPDQANAALGKPYLRECAIGVAA